MKKHIPNVLTLTNAFCGSLAIIFTFQNDFKVVFYLVCIALICDFLDGFVARLLKVGSELGGQLDSLADAITFGVLPGLVVFQYVSQMENICSQYVPYLALLVPVFSILRLAIFNLDKTQSDSFKGVPTPANCIFLISIPLSGSLISVSGEWIIVLTLIFAFLLVSKIRLIALKFKSYTFRENKEKVVLLIISLGLLFYFKELAFLFIIPLYIIISLINTFFNKIKTPNSSLSS